MALVLRKAVMPKNISLLKCMKGRPLATAANRTNASAISTPVPMRGMRDKKRLLNKASVKISKAKAKPTSAHSIARSRSSLTTRMRYCSSCPDIVPEANSNLSRINCSPKRTFHEQILCTTRSLINVSSFIRHPRILSTGVYKTATRGFASKPCPCPCPCGCLPPPCNTPAKCLQYMTGYYYYPYGFWFCGPYHVTGLCSPACGGCGPCTCPGPCKACCCFAPALAGVVGQPPSAQSQSNFSFAHAPCSPPGNPFATAGCYATCPSPSNPYTAACSQAPSPAPPNPYTAACSQAPLPSPPNAYAPTSTQTESTQCNPNRSLSFKPMSASVNQSPRQSPHQSPHRPQPEPPAPHSIKDSRSVISKIFGSQTQKPKKPDPLNCSYSTTAAAVAAVPPYPEAKPAFCTPVVRSETESRLYDENIFEPYSIDPYPKHPKRHLSGSFSRSFARNEMKTSTAIDECPPLEAPRAMLSPKQRDRPRFKPGTFNYMAIPKFKKPYPSQRS